MLTHPDYEISRYITAQNREDALKQVFHETGVESGWHVQEMSPEKYNWKLSHPDFGMDYYESGRSGAQAVKKITHETGRTEWQAQEL